MNSLIVCVVLLLSNPGDLPNGMTVESGDIKLASGKTVASLGDNYVGMQKVGGFVMIAAKDRVGCYNPGKQIFWWLTEPLEGEVSFIEKKGSREPKDDCFFQVMKEGFVQSVLRYRQAGGKIEPFNVAHLKEHASTEVSRVISWEPLVTVKKEKTVLMLIDSVPSDRALVFMTVGKNESLYVTHTKVMMKRVELGTPEAKKRINQQVAVIQRDLPKDDPISKEENRERLESLKAGRVEITEGGDLVAKPTRTSMLEQIKWILEKELQHNGTRRLEKGKHVWVPFSEENGNMEEKKRKERWLAGLKDGSLVFVSGRGIISREEADGSVDDTAQATPQTPPLPEK